MNALKNYQHHINQLLDKYFNFSNNALVLHQAMRYSLLNGGKRLRPLLVYGAGEMSHAPQKKLDNAAVAVECIHAYSLIHDDLPCMDNDDFRRGKPSCHKKFDQASAILAGDALQSFAFEILSQNHDIRQISLLSKSIGKSGMALGQAVDIAYKNKAFTQEKLYEISRLKTGCLITASVQLGLLCGEYSETTFERLTEFSENFGLAFQLRDDNLDKENRNIINTDNNSGIFFEKASQILKDFNHYKILPNVYKLLN